MTVLTNKSEVDRPMQPCLIEELAEIYITPTPRWRESQNVIEYVCVWLIDVLHLLGLIIYTRGLNMSPGQTRPVTNLKKKKMS
jgi:hypothetical protein